MMTKTTTSPMGNGQYFTSFWQPRWLFHLLIWTPEADIYLFYFYNTWIVTHYDLRLCSATIFYWCIHLSLCTFDSLYIHRHCSLLSLCVPVGCSNCTYSFWAEMTLLRCSRRWDTSISIEQLYCADGLALCGHFLKMELSDRVDSVCVCAPL